MAARSSQQSNESEEDTADHIRPRSFGPYGRPDSWMAKPSIQSVKEDEKISVERRDVVDACGGNIIDNGQDLSNAHRSVVPQVLTKEDLLVPFLNACTEGDSEKLRNDILPNIKLSKVDIREMTNDEYFTATGLHLALLSHHEEIVNLLIEEFGKKLILQHYTHTKNIGLTALHIAITQNMSEQIRKMMEQLSESEKIELIHAECKGSFFNKKWNISSVPLTLALLCKNFDIVKLLMDYGAKIDHKSVQCNGETAFHSLARHSLNSPEDASIQLKILQDSLDSKFQKKYASCTEMGKLLNVKDNDSLSPMTFSLKIQASAMVQALLDVPWVNKMPQWNYNPLQVNIYDVTDFKKKQQPWNVSGLEMLAFSRSHKMLPLYKNEPIRTLVDEIWWQYAHIHVITGIIHLVYMILFSTGVMSKHILGRPVRPAPDEDAWVTVICVFLLMMSFGWIVMTVFDILSYCVPCFSRRQHHQSKREKSQNHNSNSKANVDANEMPMLEVRPKSNQTQDDKLLKKFVIPLKVLLRFSTWKAIYFILDMFVFSWSVSRLVGNENEAAVAVIPLLLGWYTCIYYSIFFEKIFVFMLMLNNMLLSNVFYFTIALIFILLGFGMAFRSLQEPTLIGHKDMSPFWRLLNTLFRQMLALNDIDELMDDLKFPKCARIVMVAFFVVGTVLLLNTLIASMTDTYNEIKDNKVALWYRVKLQIALQGQRPSLRCIRCLTKKPSNLFKERGRYFVEILHLKHG